MLSPLDDFPIHQIAEPVLHVGTSDRNFYDRYYFNLFRRDGGVVLTAGLGQYPNLGVVDAFAAATFEDRQYVVRSSRELTNDRMDTSVGPIAVEVIEGLKRLRLVIADGEGDLELDVMWEPAIPAVLEARHVVRRGSRLRTDTSRFAQTGFWSGDLRIGDQRFDVTPEDWGGGRDRSWGIRPVGEVEPPGRSFGDGPTGFLWIYSTMQFPDFTIVYIVQEDRRGERSLSQALRVWPEASGREPETFDHVAHALEFLPGSRLLQRATLTMTGAAGEPLVVAAEPIGASYLTLGTGYGFERDWRHGMYQGPEVVVQRREFDVSWPSINDTSYGLVDNIARFELAGSVGYGLLENAVLGPNDRYGFGSH